MRAFPAPAEIRRPGLSTRATAQSAVCACSDSIADRGAGRQQLQQDMAAGDQEQARPRQAQQRPRRQHCHHEQRDLDSAADPGMCQPEQHADLQQQADIQEQRSGAEDVRAGIALPWCAQQRQLHGHDRPGPWQPLPWRARARFDVVGGGQRHAHAAPREATPACRTGGGPSPARRSASATPSNAMPVGFDAAVDHAPTRRARAARRRPAGRGSRARAASNSLWHLRGHA